MLKQILIIMSLVAGFSIEAKDLQFTSNRSDYEALIIEVAADNEISLERAESKEGNDVLNILIEKSGRKGCKVSVSRVQKHENGTSSSQYSLTKKGLFKSFESNCTSAIETIFASYL